MEPVSDGGAPLAYKPTPSDTSTPGTIRQDLADLAILILIVIAGIAVAFVVAWLVGLLGAIVPPSGD